MFLFTSHSFSSTKSLFAFCFIICVLFLSVERSSAQGKTDPDEVKAFNTILGKWGKQASAGWTIIGEPCSGAAIDSTDFDNNDINPFIKCDCTFNKNATCHITKFKVYALDVVGPIPEELQVLRYLTYLERGRLDHEEVAKLREIGAKIGRAADQDVIGRSRSMGGRPGWFVGQEPVSSREQPGGGVARWCGRPARLAVGVRGRALSRAAGSSGRPKYWAVDQSTRRSVASSGRPVRLFRSSFGKILVQSSGNLVLSSVITFHN